MCTERVVFVIVAAVAVVVVKEDGRAQGRGEASARALLSQSQWHDRAASSHSCPSSPLQWCLSSRSNAKNWLPIFRFSLVSSFMLNNHVIDIDVKRWLADLRGKDMPDSFSWSYKR